MRYPREMGRQFLTEVGLDFFGIITILAVLKLSEKELVPASTSLKALVIKFMYRSYVFLMSLLGIQSRPGAVFEPREFITFRTSLLVIMTVREKHWGGESLGMLCIASSLRDSLMEVKFVGVLE